MKTFLVTYSLAFTNDMEIEAETADEAVAKLRQTADDEGELDALGGDEDGYQIVKVEKIPVGGEE